MTTVYVVTSGEYSDYSIEGVFSTKDKAVEYMGRRPQNYNDIEEYKLDSEPNRQWGTQWIVHLTKDGNLYEPFTHAVYNNKEGHVQELSNIPENQLENGESGLGFHSDNVKRLKANFSWFRGVSYKSYDHALKLAIELRQKTLREHPDWFE